MSIKCFYHSADHDGKASGAIIKWWFKDVELFPYNYGQQFDFNIISKDDIIYMADISLNVEDMIKLNESCKEFHFIDHHYSIIDELKYRGIQLKGLLDSEKAACELTWEYITNLDKPWELKLLGSFDIGNWYFHENTIPFEYGLQFYETDPIKNMSIWENMFTINNNCFVEEISNQGKPIKLYLDKLYKDMCSKCCFKTDLQGYSAIAINTPILGSLLFDSVWDPHEYDIMIRFHLSSNNLWNCSLYTTKESINVSSIASKFGGGGHKKSSGFRVKHLPFKLNNYIY